MKKNFDVVLWDLDGTLMDTKAGILNSVRHTAKACGLKDLSDDEIDKFIGPPFEHSAKIIFGVDDKEAVKLAEVFREKYKTLELFNAVPTPYIYEVMRELKDNDVLQGLATYKTEFCSFPLMEHFKFDEYLDVMHGGIVGMNKTKKDIMMECISDLKINDMNRVLMVGDTEHDLRASMELGCYFLGVNFGFGFNDLTETDKNYEKTISFIDDIRDLVKIVIKN